MLIRSSQFCFTVAYFVRWTYANIWQQFVTSLFFVVKRFTIHFSGSENMGSVKHDMSKWKTEENRHHKVTKYKYMKFLFHLKYPPSSDFLSALRFTHYVHCRKAHYIEGTPGSSWSITNISSFHTDSLNYGRSMSMIAYIRRSIITSPGCQNDPLVEMGAFDAAMTYGSPQVAVFCSCSRGHCGVTVGGRVVWLVNRVRFHWKQETLHTAKSLHWTNFKNLLHIKRDFCYYEMSWLCTSLDHMQIPGFYHCFRHLGDAVILKVRWEGFYSKKCKTSYWSQGLKKMSSASPHIKNITLPQRWSMHVYSETRWRHGVFSSTGPHRENFMLGRCSQIPFRAKLRDFSSQQE